MSKTSATPGTAPADLLDRWLAHREDGHVADDSPVGILPAEAPTPAGTIGSDPAPEVSAPPPAAAPSAIDAGRAVLEALSNQRLEEAAVAVAETRGVAVPAVAATPAPAVPSPDHLGSAAGAPSSEVRERRAASDPPRDVRPVPGTTRASAAAISVLPSATRTRTKPATPIRRPHAAPAPDVVLRSPSRARRLLTALALATAAAAAAAGWRAWSERTTESLALAAGLAVVALVLWSARGRRDSTVVTVRDDVLRIVQGQTRHEFPLAGPHPPIDILGEPGDRGWKVLIQRRSMSPYVVTRSMVDPHAFTELVRHYRPTA